MPTTTKIWGIITLLLVFAALGLTGSMDAKDAERAQETYCEMLELWDADAALGIAPEHRRGWPPFDGRKQCN